jgi:hypothetical protein
VTFAAKVASKPAGPWETWLESWMRGLPFAKNQHECGNMMNVEAKHLILDDIGLKIYQNTSTI